MAFFQFLLVLVLLLTFSLKNSLGRAEAMAQAHKPLGFVYHLMLKPGHPKATEFAPAMGEGKGILPGLPAAAGKPVHVGLRRRRLTYAGILKKSTKFLLNPCIAATVNFSGGIGVAP